MRKYIARSIRYILPLVVLLLIAAYFILSPALLTHAAASTLHPHIVVPILHYQHVHPNWYWRP